MGLGEEVPEKPMGHCRTHMPRLLLAVSRHELQGARQCVSFLPAASLPLETGGTGPEKCFHFLWFMSWKVVGWGAGECVAPVMILFSHSRPIKNISGMRTVIMLCEPLSIIEKFHVWRTPKYFQNLEWGFWFWCKSLDYDRDPNRGVS